MISVLLSRSSVECNSFFGRAREVLRLENAVVETVVVAVLVELLHQALERGASAVTDGFRDGVDEGADHAIGGRHFR